MSYIPYPTDDIKYYVEKDFDNEKYIALYKQTKDINIRNRIVINNIGLVLKLSKKYKFPSRMPLGDIIGVGTLAIIQAIEKYDPNEKTLFSTYVTNSIKNEISIETNAWYGEGNKNYGSIIRKYRIIAIHMFGEENIFKEDIIDYVLNIMLERKLIRPGSIPEVRSRLLSTKLYEVDEDIEEQVEFKTIDEALEVPYDDEKDFDKVEFIRTYKDELYSELTDYEKEVMDYYCGFKDGKAHTQAEIGEILKVSHQAIQQQSKKATTKMKAKANRYL